jgi:hypothetical protein
VGRGIEKLRPKDAAAARQALYAIIDRATAQIALNDEAHRVRAEINDSLAADRLAFDDSPEGERLRRFDLACGRVLARSLDSLLKLRRAPEPVDGLSSELSGPSFAADETLQTSATPDETNEATVDPEIVTKEPSGACENVTNEANGACENMTNEATDPREFVTNEATDDGDIVTNEATAFCGFGMNEPTPAADVGLESPTYMNEPNDACEIVANEANAVSGFGMNEPTLAALDDSGVDEKITAGMNDGDDGDFQEEIHRQKTGQWVRAGCARMAALPAEKLRELHAQSHREAKEANASRCPRREWHKNGKPADRPQKRAAPTKPRTTGQQM